MALRSIPAEKQAISTFQRKYGKTPNSPQDWVLVHKYAYPTANDLPDEFKGDLQSSIYTGVGGTTDSAVTVKPATQTPDQMNTANMTDISKQMEDAGTRRTAAQDNLAMLTPALSSTFRGIQDGIKTKMQYQQAPIDSSQLFNAAGLTGFESLHQSLTQRAQELQDHRTTLENVLGEVGDNFKTQALVAKQNWDMANKEYQDAATRLDDSLNKLTEHERQIQLLKLKNDLDIQLKDYDLKHPSVSDQTDALSKGYEVDSRGLVTDPTKGIVQGFNISSYATDPNHEAAVASIVQGIGQFQTLQDVSNYIKRKYQNSPVTAEMIGRASEKYGVPWEVMVAMMEQDSSLGTAGKGARTFNPGNVGNDDSGAIRNYGNWQAGVDAVGAWLDKHRVTTKGTGDGSWPDTDAGEIAKAVFNGTQSPDLKGLYGKSASVKAELARHGYDLTKSQTDWAALQKYTATMNGSKILSLRSSAQTALDSLDLVKQYSDQLQSLVPRGKVPVLNHAALVAAKNGVYGQDAQNTATLLDQQISDITAELATVYKGGNGATDDALKLGATQLSSDWNKELLDKSIENVKANLRIRVNSYNTLGPSTYTGGNETTASNTTSDPMGVR